MKVRFRSCGFLYYELRKREIKIRCIYECRCDERLQTKTKELFGIYAPLREGAIHGSQQKGKVKKKWSTISHEERKNRKRGASEEEVRRT
jgi:hypothetical protein